MQDLPFSPGRAQVGTDHKVGSMLVSAARDPGEPGDGVIKTAEPASATQRSCAGHMLPPTEGRYLAGFSRVEHSSAGKPVARATVLRGCGGTRVQ